MPDITAIVALIVSAVALIIALAQLLAQIIGTVEGHWRCQDSVMGEWSRKTKRDWHWRQFRYETLFTTPEIMMMPYDPKGTSSVAVTGYIDSQADTYVLTDKSDPSHQLVCWVPLLISLHGSVTPIAKQLIAKERQKRKPICNASWPTINFRQRSWDFMPPDVVRPFATTWASDIAVLACRMGVTWKDFRPAEGIMEGQGGDHIFSATKVRGIGIMLNYTKISISSHTENGAQSSTPPVRLCVCTPEADMMWFGILRGNPKFSLPSYRIGTFDEVYETLQGLDPEGIAAQHLKETQNRTVGSLHGVYDIVPMLAPWLRQPNSTVNQYPRPLGGGTKGLTWYCVAYKVFYEELKKYNNNNGTTQTKKIETHYQQLQKHGVEWDGVSTGLSQRPVDFYDDLEARYDETTNYFLGKLPSDAYANQIKWESFHYIDLVCAHLREAPRSFVDAEREVREGRGNYDHLNTDGDRYWRGEAMHYYWCYLPDYIKFMGQRGCNDARLVEEAWITLIFRAFLWQRAHIPIENGLPLPSQYYGSRLPIYIS